mmetsp:Transcript_35216/g.77097  ORF Transcript_35216/g.77097 Transcript_35216/m.77097 type:complete len:341 (-) Transcript_35216:247-1269(-)|eukprot:CAMPEP_0178501986 /NCGR_PEP_ID=MMETSP0696-20121128/17262_1 /TAXON_ID=265572 /ORGANISM="Extubocellulus spinifer, Strain CCMP396" /LENGTH=340 /DNA_ID=CAMNT_0020131011 /DNA_START=190 /DNA_END=1212 /DNA_ORIENTATION=+
MGMNILVHTHVLGGLILLIPSIAWAWLFFGRLKALALLGVDESESPEKRRATSEQDGLLRDDSEGDEEEDSKRTRKTKSPTTTTPQTLGERYAAQYLPEPNKSVIRFSGIYFVVNSLIGYSIITITEIPYGYSLLSDTFHFLLYGLLGGTGIVYVLESSTLVPPDSGRLSHSVCLAFVALMVYVHAGLKMTPDNVLQHQFVALTNALASLALLLSSTLFNPQCTLLAYAVFLVSFAWQGLWWMTIGFRFFVRGVPWDEDYDGDDDTDVDAAAAAAAQSDKTNGENNDDWYGDDMEDVTLYFCLEGILLFAVGLVAASYIYRIGGRGQGHQETLASTCSGG